MKENIQMEKGTEQEKNIIYNFREKSVFEGQYLNGKSWNGIKYLYDDIRDYKLIGKEEYVDGIRIRANDN